MDRKIRPNGGDGDVRASLAPDCPNFKLIDFNPRRAMRGAEAARVQLSDDPTDWLWMSKLDIRQNMKAFGPHPELLRARDAYARMRWIENGVEVER